MYDFYATLCPLRPTPTFMGELVTCRSRIYDVSETFGEECLCAGVSVDLGCCYRIASMRRQRVRRYYCF